VIPLIRRDEPDVLSRKRPVKLEAARQALVDGTKPELTGYGDDGVKETLFQDQKRKCAYCEKPEEQSKYRDAEHYRPKAQYWWLTWTWENLLFACLDCNRDHKKEQFPLADEATRLRAEEVPPGLECPLLLDPYERDCNPAREIRFERLKVQRVERWQPFGLTPRGRETVRVCGLDRPGLLTLYKEHVVSTVRPKVEELLRTVEQGDVKDIMRTWARLKRGLFGEYQRFHALSRDALRVLVRADLLARHQLVV
jgi:uncharacterized protein (TIGR02646 family)